MANKQETIDEALSLIRDTQLATGKRHAQQHFQGNEVRAALEAALEHPACGKCDRLRIEFPPEGPRHVKLHCKANHSPQGLWNDWWPLEAPRTCPDCTDPTGRPPAGVKR